MIRSLLIAVTIGSLLCACAVSQPEAAADLNAGFNVAAAAEAAYAAHPGANAKTTAEMAQLLSAAQAALISWTNSQSTGDQAIVTAAIAALVAYEASAKLV
jgi:hypothetical protein